MSLQLFGVFSLFRSPVDVCASVELWYARLAVRYFST